MNKNTQIISEESQIKVNSNSNIRKSKFNKFFSTVTAVMIASSIALSPMTLRAEDTENKDKNEVKEALENLKETYKEGVKVLEKRKKEAKQGMDEAKQGMDEAKKQISEADKKIEESKRKIEDADKKIEENCKGMEKNIILATDYCTKNKCTSEQLKILKETKETYNTECKKLAIKSE